MSKFDKVYTYICDRMLAISPDERDEDEIKAIKKAKLEELQGIIDVMLEVMEVDKK